MKSRPILFTGPMVRAILSGAKTQTRRVIKPQPTKMGVVAHDGYAIGTAVIGDGKFAMWKWPCLAPGDHLWVRETWGQPDSRWDEWEYGRGKPNPKLFVLYRADDPTHGSDDEYWRPSIHMPRWASRITLEITAVRVERLQEIGEDDARREGVWTLHPPKKDQTITECSACNTRHASGIALFADLWDSLNGKRHPWASNPWVWVVEFRMKP